MSFSYRQRLIKLQSWIVKQKIDYYLLPNSDPYLNEYIPECYQRLKWLTGFSGSNATVLIGAEVAAFFTDGRYTLQAKSQLIRDYRRYDLGKMSMLQWLSDESKDKKLTIGYDSSLLSIGDVCRYSEAGHKMKPVAMNPIDELWEDRPDIELTDVELYPVKYAGLNYQQKIKHISELVKARGVHSCLITSPDSICWLLNIRARDVHYTPLALSYALITASGKVEWFIDTHRVSKKIQSHLQPIVKISTPDAIESAVKKLKNKDISLDPQRCPDRLARLIPIKNRIYYDDPCLLPKAIKHKAEIKAMKNAHIKDGAALTKFLYWFDRHVELGDITECSASDVLLKCRCAMDDFVQPSFQTIAGFKDNGAIIHYAATEETSKNINSNGLFLLDSGGQYSDGTTDVTRTILVGKPTKEQIECYTRVLKGHIAIASSVFPVGITGSDLDILARQYLWKVGLDYAHGTGHGVGCYLGVHEGPQRISMQKNNISLAPGMIISNEPGYYKEGEFGIRIESLVCVVEVQKGYLGFETLTLAPLECQLIDRSMLSGEEESWISHYYSDIKKKIAPYLGRSERAWLKERAF